jgi:hypothetical protein
MVELYRYNYRIKSGVHRTRPSSLAHAVPCRACLCLPHSTVSQRPRTNPSGAANRKPQTVNHKPSLVRSAPSASAFVLPTLARFGLALHFPFFHFPSTAMTRSYLSRPFGSHPFLFPFISTSTSTSTSASASASGPPRVHHPWCILRPASCVLRPASCYRDLASGVASHPAGHGAPVDTAPAYYPLDSSLPRLLPLQCYSPSPGMEHATTPTAKQLNWHAAKLHVCLRSARLSGATGRRSGTRRHHP